MRQCKYLTWNSATKARDEKCGMFHQWSSDFEEFENSGCTFAVGVVENADGSVALPRADWITFIDQPPVTGGSVVKGEQQLKAEIRALSNQLNQYYCRELGWETVQVAFIIGKMRELSTI